jgi:hypothetical protein
MTSKPTIDLRYSDQIFQSDVSLDAYCTTIVQYRHYKSVDRVCAGYPIILT